MDAEDIQSERDALTSEDISDEEFTKGLADVMGSLMARAREEQEASQPWKDLWGNRDDGVYGILNEAADQTGRIVRALSGVIEKQYGIQSSPKLYDLLHALPFAMPALQAGISREYGFSCCGDKARHAYALAVLDEIKNIIEHPLYWRNPT